ncbi:MAG TPA: GGDEF domain-containing protein [Candidatus Sulfotelmatobacter sp.]|nr:GGDEF domain-containing protein [Candidatus Sulfotelmatobacter sp.]
MIDQRPLKLDTLDGDKDRTFSKDDAAAYLPMGDTLLEGLKGALDFVFQPVVNVATGLCFGFEGLLRNHDQLGFPTQQALFDACYEQGVLEAAQLQLWELAVSRFSATPKARGKRLFLNMDSRSLSNADLITRHIKGLLAHYDLSESSVAFDILSAPSEELATSREWVRPFRRNSCKLSLDHYGAAMGAQLLHVTEPDFIKISPFFVRDVWSDSRKKLLLSQMVSIAHLLGIVVVACGVETEKEFLVCKEVGCDLVQGFMVAKPDARIDSFPQLYPHVEQLSRTDRRRKDGDQKIILDQMERIEPLPVDANVTAVFERLRSDTNQTFVPIIDLMGQPLGIIREANIKNYAYSPFGKDLISNKGLGRKLRDFIVRCPIAEVHMSVENIMAIYSGEEEAEGILLVEQMRYVGFLSARSIIRVINEKNLAQARDQNPLSKLPGNALINQFVNDSLTLGDERFVYAYVDFDNFKPFNDKYGFRLGDRAILLFAELMRKSIEQQHFLGHIGGDDFFIGFVGLELAEAERQVADLLAAFRGDAESFYDADARAAGFITAPDREGHLKNFPLLSASAALVEAPLGRPAAATVDDVSARIALLKKPAKNSPTKLASAVLE